MSSGRYVDEGRRRETRVLKRAKAKVDAETLAHTEQRQREEREKEDAGGKRT